MTQREKLLAAAVGVMLLAIGGIWAVNWLTTAFDGRYDQLSAAEKDFEEKEGKLRRGKAAQAQLDKWAQRSLPSDTSRAKTQYRVWLFEATRKVGLNLDIKPTGERRQGDLYVQHNFDLNGQGDAKALLQFLYGFYETGYMHRISSLTAHPVPDKRDWDVSMKIEVLSLNKAPAEIEAAPPPADPPPPKDFDTYAKTIIRRNPFSMPNNPPRFSSIGSPQAYPQQPFRLSLRASDADRLDKLTYELVSSQLPETAFDARTGELRGMPDKLGDRYEVVVRVTDDGYPPKTAEEKFTISVVSPPVVAKAEPVLRDDPARDARITGLVGPIDKLQVWVTVPRGLGDQPKTLHLNEGDAISVGSFVGTVKQVREREAEFQLKDGRTVIVQLEGALVPGQAESGGL